MTLYDRLSAGLAHWSGWRVLQAAACRARTTIRLVLLAIVLQFANGCTSVPHYEEFRATTAVLPVAAPGVAADGRARFRDIFCTLAEDRELSPARRGNACERLLWRLADEVPLQPAGQAPALDSDLQVFVVGGAFSDCFGPASMAFREAIERLAGEGYPVASLAISGRSSAEHNARMIADGLTAAADGPIVLVGYSKGALDILHFLAGYPEMARRVVAVVSVAGPIMGSEIAEYGYWAYDTFFADTFAKRCDPGDGGVLDSLLPQVRRDWLDSHPLPSTVRFYSLLAFSTREHIARALMPNWRILASSDPRNDGQLTIAEGTWPGSTLLGYANADHWGVAIDIEEELSFLAGRPDDTRYPRGALFEAALRYVSEDLRNRRTAQASAL
jgi:pimeloyl-ACP methyl ester carboxylesterase